MTTVEDQTGARAARNSKSGMVKLVLNFCVAQELLVESQTDIIRQTDSEVL